MTEYKTAYKNITVTIRTPERIMETLKQDKINYIYDLLATQCKSAKQQESKK